jgi:SAM-dependent methyltransferase
MAPDGLNWDRFPRASRYNPEWVRAGVSGGAHSLWLTEWLAEVMELRPGMRVLDLGCGRGASSIFLHLEFGVEVWATDLWFSADERWARILDAGVEGRVFSISSDGRQLPFPREFFDAVVSIDAFSYLGTDDLYASYLARFVRPEGRVGIAGAGLMRELDGEPPDHLRAWWEPSLACLHSAAWWQRHWSRSGVLAVEVADTMPDGWRAWVEWQRAISPGNHVEIDALSADRGELLGYVRAVARRRADIVPDEPITSVPVTYASAPVFPVPDA